ncbi:MAG TPA: hypothetical protein VHS58_21405 [Acetobacteraceae bacterium]|nr:hypothetical protein [Acetobacteraceae bacterium]
MQKRLVAMRKHGAELDKTLAALVSRVDVGFSGLLRLLTQLRGLSHCRPSGFGASS